MNEQDEFELWFSTYERRNVATKTDLKASWKACTERKDADLKRHKQLIKELRDIIIEHNRLGTRWQTSGLFYRMMDAISQVDFIVDESK